MELIPLGNSEIKVSPIAFGAWAIGGWMWGGADQKEGMDAVKTSLEMGMTTIDTAPVYGFGRSEELIGKALKGVPRENYQILTKYGLNWETHEGQFHFDTKDFEGNPIRIYRWSAKHRIKKECEDSLRRLNTDYIDLYQIHWYDPTTPISETMEAVLELIDEGKVRAAGVCNYNVSQVEEAQNVLFLVSNQVPYSLVHRNIEKDVIPQALKNGMSILPYSPLQRGLLTGKMKPDQKFNEGDSRKGLRHFMPENVRRINAMLEKIKPIADEHQATLAQVVLHWTMKQPAMGCVLAGARNPQQVKDNAGAMRLNLSTDELSTITDLSNELEFVEKH